MIVRCIRVALASACLLLASTPSPAQPSGVPLGVNLEFVGDWARSMMFVDAMKSARPFGSASTPWDQSTPLDASGWPTSDAGLVMIIGATDPPIDISGTYHLSFNGTAVVSQVGCSFTVANQAYDPAVDRTTADVQVPDGQSQIIMSFTQTRGGVRNIKFIRPGYPADTTQVFHTPFLNVLANFSVLRAHSYLDTEGNNVVFPAVQPWSSRRPVTYATQMSGAIYKGAAWEYLIQLANVAGKDLWLNIPMAATDDYVTQLALLLKGSLDPERVVYLELSNEIWNIAPAFPQTVYNFQAAAGEVQAGGSPLNYDGSTDSELWGRRRVAKRVVEISNLFRNVYGAGAINAKIRPVLAYYINLPFGIRDELEFIEAIYGSPRQFIYGIAGAPYMSSAATATLDQIFAGLANSSDANRSFVLQYRSLATYYDLKCLAYEGGPDLKGDVDLQNIIQANRDPRMTPAIVHDIMDNWYGAGGDLYMYFDLSGSYTKFGCYGIYEDITKPTVKSQAIAEIVSSAAPVVNAGVRLRVLGQSVALSPAQGFGRWGSFVQYGGSTIDYLLQATNAATYSVTLSLTNANEGNRLHILADNQLRGTVTFPGGSGNAPAVPMTLGPGLHTVRLAESVANGYALQSVVSMDIRTISSPPDPNTAPVISVVDDQVTNQDTPTAPIPFTVADAETGELMLTASSSNTGLVPVSNVFFHGSGHERTLVIAPAAGQSGTTQITITAVDSGGLSNDVSFTLTVIAGDFVAPVLSAIQTSSAGSSEITITWTSSEPSDSQVEYGLTTRYGSTGVLPSIEPSFLTDLDVGTPKLAGSIQMTTNGNGGRVYTVVGGGDDIGATSDDFHYAFTQVTGDFDYVARVLSLQGLDYWPRAELMARASTNNLPRGNDPFFATMTTPSAGGNEVALQWRMVRANSSDGAQASPAYRASYPNTWLRLKRQGNTFISLAGVDGTAWTELGRRDVAADQFPPSLLIGLAVTAHNDRDPSGATAVLSNLGILTLGPWITNHTVTLRGLTGDTVYHYRVSSRDAAGNLRASQDFTFRTLPATNVTTVTLSTNPAIPSVKRFGINLEWYNFYDSGQIMKNLVLRNAGFEGLVWQSTLRSSSGTSTSCMGDSYVSWPDGFWNGAAYEFIWGAAKGRTGTVSTYTAPVGPNGPVFQFADSGAIPNAGDYLILRKTMPSDAVSGWGPYVSGGGLVSTETNDLAPGTEGHQAIRLTALENGQSAGIQAAFDTWGRGLTFLQLNGRYRLAFKAKGVGGANQLEISFGRATSPFTWYFWPTLTLSNSWSSYALEFTAAEDGTVLGDAILKFMASASAILLDDVSLVQVDTDPTNPTAFRDPVVNALKTLRPGILRNNSQYQLGDTFDNLIAAPFARQRSGYAAYATTQDQVGWGLHEFLELCELVDAEPWFTLPITFSTSEITHLMEYLGGDNTTAYGAKRAARGHSATWASSFSRIHLELGNEAWNSVYKGGNIESSVPYGNRGNELFGAAKSSPQYDPAKYSFVLNGQADWVNRNVEIANASTNHDTFGLSPYIAGTLDNYANLEELFGPLFAEPEMVNQSGNMRQNLAVVQNATRPVPIALYEVNIAPYGGSISQAALDSFAPSLGAGLATVNHMLMMLRDLGIKDQNFFCLNQFAWWRADGKLAKVWGAVRDMGVTDRRRPQFLALQLANEAIGGDLLQTSLSGDDPTWNQPLMNGVQREEAHYLQAYAFSKSNRTSLVLFNLSRSATLPVNFSGPNFPTGAVRLKRLTSDAITNSNEDAELVRTMSQTLAGFGSSQPFSLPPYSMTLLQWPAALATASLVSPTNAAKFQAPASVLLTATANDPDGTLQKVEFFQGSTKIGEAATAPFTCTWTNVAPGDYLLSARAVGLAGVSPNSTPIWITVNAGPSGPTIIAQPHSTNFTAGAKVTLGVVATGAAPLVYQWLFNGTNLGNASADSMLTLDSIQTRDSGSYAVVVSNAAGSVTSQSFTLTVLPGYSIGLKFGADQLNSTLAPTDVAGAPGVQQAHWNNLRGSSGTMTQLVADASGVSEATAVSVQWADLSGTFSSVREDVHQTNGASFMVGTADHVLMAGYLHGGGPNSTRIAIADLPPQLTAPGYEVYIYALASEALNGGGYRVLDASDGHVIRDYVLAESPMSPTSYVQVPTNLGPGQYGIGDYLVFSELTATSIVIEALASSSLGILNAHWPYSSLLAPVNAIQLVTKPIVNLSVIAPSFTVPPQSQVAVAGSSPTFQVLAAGSTPLRYQWQFNGVDLDGATNAALTVERARIADDGSYRVVVSNPAGAVTSPSAILTVNDTLEAPIITEQPQALVVAVGQSATFNVAAARTALSGFQWLWNGANITGATNASLTLNHVQLSDSGNYSVVVANSAGSVTSATALLTVVGPPVFGGVTQAGGTITFSWSATPGQAYQVQYATNLSQPNWTDLSILTATNSTATMSDDPNPDTQRFYRILWLP